MVSIVVLHVFFRAMKIAMRMTVDVVGAIALRPCRTMGEVQIMALESKLDTVTYEIPIMVVVPL